MSTIKPNFDTLFPDKREDGETTLRQCQLVMLRILKIFDYLCKRHEIDYFLTGGTLLGAIRHQGFIPWDDDIDVGMTRSNYEKFIRYAVPELPNDIFFQNQHTDAFYAKISGVDARLRDKYSSYSRLAGEASKAHEGLMVDIFVYDRAFLPHNLFVIIQNRLMMTVLKTSHRRAKVLKWIARAIPVSLVYCSNYMRFYGDRKKGTFVTPKELSVLVRTKFEDMEALIPASFHSYLSRQYGDYMVLPPEDKRFAHRHVKPNPFTPCDHKEVLMWNTRTAH
jgi:lipopolysaccharide cholinephosphotransferase